jgi:predicted transporter
MLDSLLTLTKGRAFWLIVAFAVALLAHVGVAAVTATQEPIFLLGALLIPVFLVVAGTYTIGKWIVKRTGDARHPDSR